ncbi:MAG: galactose-1-phosphate uridylyltransferase [Dehalococcoidales bacterium]|nr:galactose-1-phosphate uridylyltransferase [Dehalococcoidales bacterium]
MSEIRQDPTTKEWVIIATERRKRPSDFIHRSSRDEKPSYISSCPFCPGNEDQTTPAIYTAAGPDGSPWQVRVVPNKYPALTPEGDTSRRVERGCFLSMQGTGFHEVIVETPLHNKPLALMNDYEVSQVLLAYRQRYLDLSADPDIKSIIIFKNHGPGAGTSLEHPHSQLVATPVVPRHMRMQYEVAISYFDDNGTCLYNDIMMRELAAGERIVMETDEYVIFHPFASHRPFETWLMPRANQTSFSQASPEDIHDLAKVLRLYLLKLYRGLDNPDFNLVIDSAPVGEGHTDFYQWHVRIIPRITEAAGFEIGSGIYINTALPEETAAFIRDLTV